MIKPELYNKTVNVLFDSYFKDELRHNDCAACAVGNICLAAGAPLYEGYHMKPRETNLAWSHLFFTEGCSKVQVIDESVLNDPNVMRIIGATGYTWQELAKIEHAFETAVRGKSYADYTFNGLVAVLEVLKQIHEVDDEPAQQSKSRFEQHYATLTA